ncbi:MAG TPA: hypothetical protein VFA18_21355, partial [Gemmataceae bacterium]|nr:hypothetical protein [Gemmataceae bacterium]
MSMIADTDRERLDRLQRVALIAGAVCLVLCAIGGIWQTEQFFRVYLVNFQFVMDFALGSMALLMIYWLTSGAWGWFLRRFVEAAMRTLPLAALFFIPVGIGVGWLYPWATPEGVAKSAQIRAIKDVYLNVW